MLSLSVMALVFLSVLLVLLLLFCLATSVVVDGVFVALAFVIGKSSNN